MDFVSRIIHLRKVNLVKKFYNKKYAIIAQLFSFSYYEWNTQKGIKQPYLIYFPPEKMDGENIKEEIEENKRGKLTLSVAQGSRLL